MGNISTIIDLHGNIFEVGEWKFKASIPRFDKLIYTKDVTTGRIFNLALRTVKKTRYRAFYYSEVYETYIEYKLKLTGYEPKYDIRSKRS